MKILHIDSSVRGRSSISKELSKHFVQQLQVKFPEAIIDHLDLAENAPSHPTKLFIQANYAQPETRTEEMKQALAESNALVKRMHDAEIIVFGIPMHNFSIPSVFKAFIDNIVRINETFAMTPEGAVGLLKNKKVCVISTRGVDFNNPAMEAMDHIKPYLKLVFNLLGMSDLGFIDVSPVPLTKPEVTDPVICDAKHRIQEHVRNLTAAY